MPEAPQGQEYLLGVRGVSKHFGPVVALDRVDFDIAPGEVHALVGENGAGKSTLMMILSGVHQPDTGQILVRGQPVRLRDPAHAQSLGIATVFQDLSLVPALSVAENIFLNRLRVRTGGLVDWKQLFAEAAGILNRLGVRLDPRVPVSQLSQSARQLVEIAKALSRQTSVLLLDEPTSALSEAETRVLAGVIHELRRRSLGIVLITHRLGEVLELADRITVLRDGRRVGTYRRGEVTREDLVRLMVGRAVTQQARVRNGFRDEPLLEACNLSAGRLLRGVNLRVHRGEVVGVAGLDGSGRHELGLALFGALPLETGELRFLGQRVRWRHPGDAVRAGVAFLPPNRKTDGLFMRQSVTANVVTAILWRITRRGVVKSRLADETAAKFQRALDIRCSSLSNPVAQLSGGNQQKVLLARWLAAMPRVLIADDPTVGIDTGAKAEIHAILSQLAQSGTGIVLVSSELMELIALADRIIVLSGGVIAGEVPGTEATEEVIMALASSDVARGQGRETERSSAHVS